MTSLKIPNNFFFYWTGQDFQYVNYLAVLSLVLNNKEAHVKIYVGEKPRNNIYWEELEALSRSSLFDIKFQDTDFGILISEAGYDVKVFEKFFNVAGYNHKSDLIRYLLLYNYGGIYLDFDILVIKNLRTLQDNHFFVGYQFDKEKKGEEETINGAVMGAEKSSKVLKKLIDETIFISEKNKIFKWGTVGPKLLTKLLIKEPQATIYPPEFFYSIPWPEWKNIFNSNSKIVKIEIIKDSYLIHFWHTLSKDFTKRMDREYVLNDSSLYSTIAKRYLIKNPFDINNWKSYYINLEERVDRKGLIEAELAKQGIEAERFNAFRDDAGYNFPKLHLCSSNKNYHVGELGCTYSHYGILKKHLESNSDKTLAIFEDDVHFCLDFKERLKYLENNFGQNWDIFYLSADIELPHNKKTKIRYVWEVKGSVYGTHAMLFNPKSIPKILKLMEEKSSNFSAVDYLFSSFLSHLKVYCFVPGMATQDSEIPSDINSRTNVTKNHILIFGDHVYAENMVDYDYRKTGILRSRIDFYRIRTLSFIGRTIHFFSPKLYTKLKYKFFFKDK